MKKKLLTAVIALLCLVLLGSAVLTAMVVARSGQAQSAPSAGAPQTTPLSAEEFFAQYTPSHKFDMTSEGLVSPTSPYQVRCVPTDAGYYTFEAQGNDPYIFFSQNKIYTAGRYVVISYRSHDAGGNFIQFYIGNGHAPSNDDTMMKTEIVGDGDWHLAIFDTSNMATGLYNGKTAGYFRLDPIDGPNAKGTSIDIAYIAFYSGDAFDYQEYLDFLEAEEAKKNQVEWPVPDYVEQETVAADVDAGSLTYTPSEDGSTVTITYKVNGEEKSYTVPNNHNYTSGGFVGTDDLGRNLYQMGDKYTYTGNAPNKEGTVELYNADEKYVGLFYFLWLGEHKASGGAGDNGIYDLQKILDNNPPEVYQNANSGVFGPQGAHHFFAEPLYGYYYSKDEWVMRKHAELLCNANIDFLYLDVTNGVTYISNALQLMRILHELNEQGYDAPQVVFYTNSGSGATVQQLYDSIYKVERYPDTWFCLNGKPVIVATEEISKTLKDYFCIKASQWPNEADNVNGWPWMDFNWPQRVFTNENGEERTISVSIAQHNKNVFFSSNAFYGNKYGINRGRSFNARFNSDTTLNQYRENLAADPTLTLQGLNFQAQWDKAIHEDVDFVLVTGWNEWVAQRIPADTLGLGLSKDVVYFVDTASMEYSRDAEMMRGGYFDNYYMQLIYNIEKIKGDAPIVVQDMRKPINVTGDFDQWADVPVTYYDPSGDCKDRNAKGYGQTIYKDTSGRNDIVASKITADTKNVYFYAQTVYDVSMFDTQSSWMQLFINVDNDTTGWYGYDYIINYQAKDAFTTTVAKYNGTDGEYSFEVVGDISYRALDNEIMLAVPQEMLGIDGYLELCFQFKWADSETNITTMEQFYTDGDAAPLGRLNFIFQNYIPGVSEITYPEIETETETETESVTETETETVTATDAATAGDTEPAASESKTDAATAGDTEPATEEETSSDEGCTSVVGISAAAVILTAAAAAVVLRKKEEI